MSNFGGPDMMLVNVEGGEENLFSQVEALNGVEQVLISVRQRLVGRRGVARLFADMARLGFAYDAQYSAGRVLVFQRACAPV